MIHRFIKVANGLYRGSGPSVEDVIALNKNFGIKKIISLDEMAGKRIDRITKLLGIKHITIPLNGNDLLPLTELFSYNLKNLLLEDGPTFVHCIEGKDRTGMVIAMFRCKYQHMSYEDAIKEAENLGFGIGLDPAVIHLYKKLICKACAKNHGHTTNSDTNNLDIVENLVDHTRDYKTDFMDSVIDEATMTTFVPYLDYNRQYPYNPIYDYKYEQNDTRHDRERNPEIEIYDEPNNNMPWVGLYDNDAGIKGIGPVDNGGGFTAT